MNHPFRFALRLLLASMVSLAPSAFAATAPAGGSMLLGIQNGLVQKDALTVAAINQTMANFIGDAAGQRVIWQDHFTANDVQSTGPGHAYNFAFVKPPNLTALLLSKGWHLVAAAKSPVEFGMDFIAQPCPTQPGQIVLGGSTLAILGVQQNIPQTCVNPAKVWSSPSVYVLVPAKGSLSDVMARKMWRERGGAPSAHFIYAQYQNAVTGFMEVTHAAVIGVVTPLVSKAWKEQGGVVLDHQPMPFWAVLAAPGTPAATVDKVRSAFLSGNAQSVNAALHIPGWEAGNPKAYGAFMHWLKSTS